MNKQEMKKVINEEFGFSTSKIDLLEGSKNSFGKYDYIMFSVCGIEYQMDYSYIEGRYKLRIYESDGRIEKEVF